MDTITLTIRNVFLVLIGSLLWTTTSMAQAPNDGIVCIHVYGPSGDEIEIGSGIIVGKQNDKIAIVTAFHVIDSSYRDIASVQIQLHQPSFSQYEAEVYKVKAELDLALLITVVPEEDEIEFATLQTGTIEDMKDNENVMLIGHPQGLYWEQDLEHRLKSSTLTGPGIFAVGGGTVVGGYSGGGVFSESGNTLLGMITESSNVNTYVLRMDEIIRQLSFPPKRIKTNLLANPLPKDTDPVEEIPAEDVVEEKPEKPEDTKPGDKPTSPVTKPTANTTVFKQPLYTGMIIINTLDGNWKNIDKETRGLKRAVIAKSGNAYTFNGFGACGRGECDWKKITLTKKGDSWVGTYDFNFKKTKVTVSQKGSQLVVVTNDKYNDGRAARNSTYLLEK